jgi:hypothetical protein
MASGRYVFDFDERTEGGKELLGGKGTGLAEMTALGIPVQWHPFSGDHSTTYWSAHVADYLGFYAASFSAAGV